MKGSYYSANGGSPVNGIRALTGSPAFVYSIINSTNEEAANHYELMKEAYEANYITCVIT